MAGALGALALVVVAVALAARSEPAPREQARPTLPPYPPAPGLVDPGTGVAVLDTAVVGDLLYALVGSCADPAGAPPCRVRLLVRAEGRWSETALRLPPAGGGDGLPGRLVVTGTDSRYLAVLDEVRARAYVSADSGRTFADHPLRTGPPVPALPAGLLPEVSDGRLVVLDPTSGAQLPLASQPPIAGLRSVSWESMSAGEAGVLRAAGQEGDTLVVAASTDGGRRWTRTELGRLPSEVPGMALVPPPFSEVAYLLVSTARDPNGPFGLTEVWRTDGPSAWTRIAPPGARLPGYVEAVGMSDGGILITDGAGSGWRMWETGTLRPLSSPTTDGSGLLAPVTVRRDLSSGDVVAVTADRQHLLVLPRLATQWTVERLPG